MIKLTDITTPAAIGSGNFTLVPPKNTEIIVENHEGNCFSVSVDNPDGYCFTSGGGEADCFSIERGSDGQSVIPPEMPEVPVGEVWSFVGITSRGYDRSKAVMVQQTDSNVYKYIYMDMYIDVTGGVLSYGIYAQSTFKTSTQDTVAQSVLLSYDKKVTSNQLFADGFSHIYEMSPVILHGRETTIEDTITYASGIPQFIDLGLINDKDNAALALTYLSGLDIREETVETTTYPTDIYYADDETLDIYAFTRIEREDKVIVCGSVEDVGGVDQFMIVTDATINITEDAWEGDYTLVGSSLEPIGKPIKLDVFEDTIGYLTGGNKLYLFEIGNSTAISETTGVNDFTFYNEGNIVYTASSSNKDELHLLTY